MEEVDKIDIILSNNPGNFKRKKAVTVDLSEFEQLRRELVDNYQDDLIKLRRRNGFKIPSPTKPSASVNSDTLKALVMLDKNRNPSNLGKQSLKSFMSRNIVMKQMNSNPGIIQIGPCVKTQTPKKKEEPMEDSETTSNNLIKYLYHLRPT